MSVRRRRSDRSPALLTYTAITIGVAAVAFAWAVVTFPIDEAISLTSTGGREGILLGLVFWVVVGLLGGMRVERLRGHGALTFHLPFIVAAMSIGGPVAGAVVAMVSTVERRELEEMPWYGAVSNHAHLTLAAIAGGVSLLVAHDVLRGFVGDDPQAVELVAIVVGGLVFALTATALAAGTIILRDRLSVAEASQVYDTSFRLTSATEVVVGWILVITYVSVGWWAALICTSLVLVIWQGHDAREIARHDPMTGLLSRAGYHARLADAVAAATRRGMGFAVVAIDLDGFKAINDKHGHLAGDDVIRMVGARIRGAIRLTDAGTRLGGDEYGILLTDIPDEPTARLVADRIRRSITAAMAVGGRSLRVGASFGMLVVEPDAEVPTINEIHATTDRLMYEAKAAAGGKRARTARASRGESDLRVDVIRAGVDAVAEDGLLEPA